MRLPPRPSRRRVLTMLAMESVLAIFGIVAWRVTGDLFWLFIAIFSVVVGVWVVRFL